MEEEIAAKLIREAVKAKQFSQAPYSKFRVGAAILSENGEIIKGSNIESSSFGLTICAERVALVKALSEGKTSFKSIAIAGKEGSLTPPCGACRQFLFDYAPHIEVILTDGQNKKTYTLKELLPVAFEDSNLDR